MLARFFRKPQPLTADEVATYRMACETLSTLLRKHGITHTKPYRDFDVPRLHAHRDPRRAIATLVRYVEVLVGADREGDDLTDTKKLVWRMLRVMRMTPQSDLFDKIENHHVLEIYSNDNWQIFRNLNFFRHVSMSVDEIATLYWPRDSKRDMKIHLRALEVAARVSFGALRKTTDLRAIPAHFARELIGDGWLIEIRLQWVSPLRNEESGFHYLVTNESHGNAKPGSPAVLPP